ncbi:fused DSP-PTPase phosphatase/NAD kinase-like protein [Hyphococcus sp.]|jgi:protein tyrosine/serine phosphatase|uniref:fused DSP-PTPase phosphatase/NAD kinase-like protein n=1 Tax=Hyphococcus sp. TaxID=2038636 RepID=UPI003D0A25DA
MSAPLTREDFETPEGRKRAFRELMLRDHGFLRTVYDNSHEIAPGRMWRTYQPSPKHLERWAARGVKTVINLRGPKPTGQLFLEEEACEQLGLALVNFRVYSREAPSKEILHGARKLFAEIEYPAIMHCKSGADRAGLMATLFLFFHEGVPLDQALDQLSFKYGHVKAGKTGVIDAALARYIAYAKDKGISLSDVDAFFGWVDRDYDPAEVKAAFHSKGWGDLLTEVILRRE